MFSKVARVLFGSQTKMFKPNGELVWLDCFWFLFLLAPGSVVEYKKAKTKARKKIKQRTKHLSHPVAGVGGAVYSLRARAIGCMLVWLN